MPARQFTDGEVLTATKLNDLSNEIDTKAANGHTHAASAITSGVLNPARMGTGIRDSTTVLHGDGVFRAGPRALTLTVYDNREIHIPVPFTGTLGTPTESADAGAFAYAYAANGTTFSAATFPLAVAENAVLRITSSGITSRKHVIINRTT